MKAIWEPPVHEQAHFYLLNYYRKVLKMKRNHSTFRSSSLRVAFMGGADDDVHSFLSSPCSFSFFLFFVFPILPLLHLLVPFIFSYSFPCVLRIGLSFSCSAKWSPWHVSQPLGSLLLRLHNFKSQALSLRRKCPLLSPHHRPGRLFCLHPLVTFDNPSSPIPGN